MKKISLLMLALLVGKMHCASSSDKEADQLSELQHALMRVMLLARSDGPGVCETRKLVLESAQLPGGRLSIMSSNIAISTLLTSPSGEKGYALSQWKTRTGKPGALALCARSLPNKSLPMPLLDYVCKAFVKFCSEKFQTSSDAASEELQKNIDEAAHEIKEVPLGSALFVSGILIQSGTLYSLMGNNSFSSIKVQPAGRTVHEQKGNYSLSCGPFSSSWDPC